MARWLVTRNDSQFAVGGLAELRDLAKAGRLAGGDMVQPPGASGWLYAVEIPELTDALSAMVAEGRLQLGVVDDSGLEEHLPEPLAGRIGHG